MKKVMYGFAAIGAIFVALIVVGVGIGLTTSDDGTQATATTAADESTSGSPMTSWEAVEELQAELDIRDAIAVVDGCFDAGASQDGTTWNCSLHGGGIEWEVLMLIDVSTQTADTYLANGAFVYTLELYLRVYS